MLLSAILKIDPFEFRWVRHSYPFMIGFALIMWLMFEIKNRSDRPPPGCSADNDQV